VPGAEKSYQGRVSGAFNLHERWPAFNKVTEQLSVDPIKPFQALWIVLFQGISQSVGESHSITDQSSSLLYLNRTSPRRERAVRMVLEQQTEHSSQWATIQSIASKLGCTSETLRRWVRRTERDQGIHNGMTSDDRERLKKLERENRELKRANEILRKASAFFAQAELDRPVKKW